MNDVHQHLCHCSQCNIHGVDVTKRWLDRWMDGGCIKSLPKLTNCLFFPRRRKGDERGGREGWSRRRGDGVEGIGTTPAIQLLEGDYYLLYVCYFMSYDSPMHLVFIRFIHRRLLPSCHGWSAFAAGILPGV